MPIQCRDAWENRQVVSETGTQNTTRKTIRVRGSEEFHCKRQTDSSVCRVPCQSQVQWNRATNSRMQHWQKLPSSRVAEPSWTTWEEVRRRWNQPGSGGCLDHPSAIALLYAWSRFLDFSGAAYVRLWHAVYWARMLDSAHTHCSRRSNHLVANLSTKYRHLVQVWEAVIHSLLGWEHTSRWNKSRNRRIALGLDLNPLLNRKRRTGCRMGIRQNYREGWVIVLSLCCAASVLLLSRWEEGFRPRNSHPMTD